MKLNALKSGSVIAAIVFACAAVAPAAFAQAGKAADAPPTATPAAKPPAAAPAASPDLLIDQLLVVSGFKHQVTMLPDQMIAGLKISAAQQKQAGPINVADLEKIFRETVTAQGFIDRGAAALKKNYDEPRMRAVLDMISTPLAKLMTEFERTPGSPQDLAAFAGSLAGKPLPPARIDLLKRLDAASRTSELAVEAMLTSIRAMTIGAIGNDPKKIAELDRGLEKNRPAAAERMRDQILLSMAFTYRKATDADLNEYITQLSSDNGKWFGAMLSGALIDQFKDNSTRIGERIAALVKAAKGAQTAAAPSAPVTTAAATAAAAPADGAPAADAPPVKRRSRANEDARHCLKLTTDKAIIKCAEQYL